MERLRVSEDGRRLVTESGAPFFYLADTAWTLPQRLKWDDALEYLNRRKLQGFTAVQLVALVPERDADMRNPAGIPALHDDDPLRPNEGYLRYLDWVITAAEHLGLYVLLVPVWGQLVVGDNWGGTQFPKTVGEHNAYGVGEWIGSRYRDRPNIIWCLGGDRQPIHKGTDYRDVWRRMAEGLAAGATGIAARHDQPSPAWDQLLITYHTCYEMESGEYSSMSYWSDDEAWLSFVALQSGHGSATRNFAAVEKEIGRDRRRPVIDIEPAYERMPMNWPVLLPLHDDVIVRKRAYWSLLAGAAGHTYGHASVWCMISEKERDEVLSSSWFEALDHPGAHQMTIVRNLVESTSFERWTPAQGMLAHADECGDDCLGHHRQAARDVDGHFALVYLTDGGSERVDLSGLTGEQLFAEWLDPRDGRHVDLSHRESDEPTPVDARGVFTFGAPSFGEGDDWLLLIGDDPAWLRAAGQPQTWGEPLQATEMSMIWA